MQLSAQHRRQRARSIQRSLFGETTKAKGCLTSKPAHRLEARKPGVLDHPSSALELIQRRNAPDPVNTAWQPQGLRREARGYGIRG